MRIIDAAKAGSPIVPVKWSPRPAPEAIAAAQPVQIDNVADYVFRNVKVGDSWDLTVDFPNLAPPFELAWFEYRRPPGIASIRHFDDDATPANQPGLPDHIGVLVEANRTDDGWRAFYYVYVQWGKEPPRGPITLRIACDKEGRAIEGDNAIEVLMGAAPRAEGDARAPLYFASGADLLIPVLFATSLLHSKNVTIEREPPIDAGFQRSWKKRHGTERVRFHVLHIEPMRKVLRSAGAESAETGVRQALHIVRGHFKDYRDGRGLFGRYQGLYWWDQHVAGTESEGTLLKEYAVHAPKGTR